MKVEKRKNARRKLDDIEIKINKLTVRRLWTGAFGCSDLWGPNIFFRLAQESDIFFGWRRFGSESSDDFLRSRWTKIKNPY